jgi:hypothetical protein
MSNFLERAKIAYQYPRTQENLEFLQNIQKEAIAANADEAEIRKIGWLLEGFTRATLSGLVDFEGAPDLAE